MSGTKSSPGVIFDMDPAAHFSDVTVHANWVEFRGGQIDSYGWWRDAVAPVPSNVTFRDITAKTVAINGGTNISVIGGSVGGYTAPSGNPAAIFLYGDTNRLSNVLIDDVDFHDITHAVASDHFEAIRIDDGAHDITIKRSRFRNITANSSIIFLTNTETEPGDPYNFTLENNFFAPPQSGSGGGAYYVFNMNAVVQTCLNFAFRYNSFASSPAAMQCATKSNVSWIGNIGPKSPGCEGNTFSHNVWQWDTSATTCSSSDRWVSGPQYSVSNLGFANPSAGDLHLLAGSPARDVGDGLSFPATDIDCAARLLADAPDAGADEYGMTGSCVGGTPPPVDTTAPDTTITSGPPSSTESTSASFSFTSTESGGTFSCRLDGGSWSTCTSPKTYSSLSTTGHTVDVRATDAAGNVDASPATWTWTVTSPPPADTTAPETTITTGPPSSTESTSASLSFTSNELGATFACRIDAGSWSACTSPQAYSGLATGDHAVDVRATDAAGNVDATPATWTWTITAPAPPPPPPPPPPVVTALSVSLVAPLDGAVFSRKLVMSATTSGAPATVVHFYDGTTWLASDSSAPYAFTWRPSKSVAYGSHVIKVVAVAADGTTATNSATVTRSSTAITTTSLRSTRSRRSHLRLKRGINRFKS